MLLNNEADGALLHPSLNMYYSAQREWKTIINELDYIAGLYMIGFVQMGMTTASSTGVFWT